MGLFIALKNAIDDRVAAAKPKKESKEIERVRVNFDEK
jgi:electron transport complex protein RnfE